MFNLQINFVKFSEIQEVCFTKLKVVVIDVNDGCVSKIVNLFIYKFKAERLIVFLYKTVKYLQQMYLTFLFRLSSYYRVGLGVNVNKIRISVNFWA